MARIVRILVYEGPQEWLEATLANKNRFVQGDKVVNWTRPGGHTSLGYPVGPAVPEKTIREAILPSPSSDFASLNSRALAIFDEVRGERSPEVVQAVEDLVSVEHLEEEERSQEDYR